MSYNGIQIHNTSPFYHLCTYFKCIKLQVNRQKTSRLYWWSPFHFWDRVYFNSELRCILLLILQAWIARIDERQWASKIHSRNIYTCRMMSAILNFIKFLTFQMIRYFCLKLKVLKLKTIKISNNVFKPKYLYLKKKQWNLLNTTSVPK